jgi:hypothetical protein
MSFLNRDQSLHPKVVLPIRPADRGWLVLHESGTFVRFTQAGADLFA